VDSDNHSAWIVVVSITFLVYATIGVTAKILSRFRRSSVSIDSLKTYDWAVMGGLALLPIQTALIIVACRHGLGQHEVDISSSDLVALRKVSSESHNSWTSANKSQHFFASNLLGTVIQLCGKAATALIIIAINERKGLNVACTITLGVCVLWAIAAVFVLAFRCGSSPPWRREDESCLNAFQTYGAVNVVNILSDIALVVLPCIMTSRVQTRTAVKLRVSYLFMTRLM
jgi:hypothetical protein